jgi:glutamate synthase (NADPH/NADH) small chain
MAQQRMLKFVSVPRDMPVKRAAQSRREDFGEIYQQFAAEKAAEQAGRCSQCGVPYCQTHCRRRGGNGSGQGRNPDEDHPPAEAS